MIKVENLFHDYEGKGKYAVNDVSFEIEKGEIFGFLGPSGAGKSTVQGIMTGLLDLQQGLVNYNGDSIKDIRAKFFNQIGVSFELPNLYSKLSGYENLKYYAGLFDVPTIDPYQLLEMVGMKSDAHKKVGAYSRGMKQRLTFIRSLVNRPEILFLDEPTGGLDPNTAEEIKTIIKNQIERGATIFLTTHNMFTADELCDRVAFINEGKIVALDTPRNLKLQYGDKSVVVEYANRSEVQREIFFLENEVDKEKLNKIINEKDIQTMHSQEATLEQIFMKLTGRGLV